MMVFYKKQVFNILILCLITFLSLTFSGCWNYRDLEDLAILAGAGLDLDENGQILFTAQVINASALKSGESGSALGGAEEIVVVTSSRGDTVFQTLRSFIPQASRRLYLSHMQILVIGQEAAEEGIYSLIDFFLRDHESRPGIRLLISHGRAEDVLRSYDGLESIPAIGISNAVQASARNGFIPDVNLQDFANRLMSSTTAPIAPHIGIYEEKGFNNEVSKRVRTVGTVVFRKDKMIGELGAKETRGLCWILGEVKSGIVPFQDKGAKGSFEVTKTKPTIKARLVEGEPVILVELYVEGNFGEEQGSSKILVSEEIPVLEEKIGRQVKNEIHAAVAKAKDLKSDVFGFGDVMHRTYPKEWKEMETNWSELFPEMTVNVSVTARINEIGMIKDPLFRP